MYKPYCYLIKHLSTGRVYYGSKYGKNANPSTFWIDYFTSSKTILSLIEKEGKDSFVFEIRKTFKTAKKCIEWEQKVLRRLNAINRDIFFNKNISGMINIEGSKNPNYGKKHKHISDRMKSKNPMKNQESVSKMIETRNLRHSLGFHKPSKNTPESIEKTRQRMKADNPMKDRAISLAVAAKRKAAGHYNPISCPHCGYTTRPPNIYRFHFKNCKHQPEQATHSSFDAKTPACVLI